MSEKRPNNVLVLEGKFIELDNLPAYLKRLSELDNSYHTRIFNEDQVVIEKKNNPHYRTGQYYFSIKTCNGVAPKKHTN